MSRLSSAEALKLRAHNLGVDRWDVAAKGFQYSVALAGFGGDDSEHVDHDCVPLRFRDRLQHSSNDRTKAAARHALNS